MSCIYCDIKMRPLDDDTKVLKGDGWKDGLGYEGGYIGPSHDGKFRMVVSYDAGFASTEVDNIKYCPFCGAELKMPPEPLIKDKKIRKAVRAWWNIQENPFECAAVLCKSYTGVSGNKDHDGYYNYCIYGYVQSHNINKTATDFEFRTKTYFKYDRDKDYTIAELCGEEEE